MDRTDPRWEESWRHLLETYAPAMRRYVGALLAGARGPADAEEVHDVVQEFLLSCVEKGWLAREAASLRCFRAYLQVQLKRFTWNHVERRSARKRDPGAPLHSEGLEDVAHKTPDPAAGDLDVAFVQVALDRALAELRAKNEEYAEVIADLLRTHGEGSPDLAERLGRDADDVAVLRHRARRRFAALFADELRATVRDDEAFGDLLQRLDAFVP